MIDISIIIFAVSLIAIVVMLVSQHKKLKVSGDIEKDFPSKDLSYENFQDFNSKIKSFWLIFIHSTAIIGSKIWARITHYLSFAFNKGVKKIEERIIRSEKKGQNGEVREQSVFLTTIKAYKHEIKKLKGRVEEEKPRPRANPSTVDLSPEDNKIVESKPE